MPVGSISTCSPPGPALWVQRMGSLNEGQRRAGAGHSGRCPCQALSHLSSHTKLHIGSKASVSTQEDTEAQGK